MGGACLLSLVGCAPIVPTSNNPKVKEAEHLSNQGNLDAALAALDHAIRGDYRDSVAWNNRGTTYLQKGLYDKAIEDYSKAIVIDEAGVYYANRGLAKRNKGVYDLAIAGYKRAIEFGYKDPSVPLGIGISHYYMGRYAETVDALNEVIRQDPNNLDSFSFRGVALARLKRYQEAIVDLDRYLSSTPGDSYHLWWQGEAFMKTGQADRARTNVRKLIELEPRLAVNFSGDRALDLYDLQKRQTMAKQALAAAQEAASNSRWPEAFQQYERGRTWVTGLTEQGRTDGATISEGLRRIYAKLPTKPDLPEGARRFGVQAVSLAEQKNYDRAIALYAKALGVAYWWPEAHFNLALRLAEQADFVGAIAEMKAFLELAPTAPDARTAQDKIYEWELHGK
ncbi:MAG: tetratricopeptide repeat protein [Nitrospira sp.]|nr:tetratricopeptide repeat protein [Nitrospira sp.]